MIASLEKKLDDPLFKLGLLTLGFWIFDSYNKIFIHHAPYRMLWFSSMGLLFITIALFTRNIFLLTMLFCTHLIIETLWGISFFSLLFFNRDLTQIASYAFVPNFPTHDLLTTTYHFLIVPSIIYALYKVKKVHPFGWVGGFYFTTILGIITYLSINNNDNVNCVLEPCQGLFTFIYQLPYPQNLFFATSLLTAIIFYPLNRLLCVLSRKNGWKVIESTKKSAAIT